MPIYRPVGNQLMTNEEIAVAPRDVLEAAAVPESVFETMTQAFEPVGMNKPLLIEIRYVYTGQYPSGRWGPFSPNDMLVTSAVRSLATFNASPKAINFLVPDAAKQSSLNNPQAGRNGTPVVFYVPALTEANSILDVEIIFDKFDAGLVEAIGSAFIGAAAIPLFAAYSTHLLAAGAVTKLAGRAGERLFDGKPTFTETFEVSFARAGSPLPSEGFYCLAQPDFDIKREGFQFDTEIGRVVDQNGVEYKGPHPYVVISIDGREDENYNEFVPTAVSAALLERFYHIRDGQEQPLDMLMEAVKLYSDLQYKRKAEGIDKRLAELEPSSEEYEKLLEEKKAYLANLITDAFVQKES